MGEIGDSDKRDEADGSGAAGSGGDRRRDGGRDPGPGRDVPSQPQPDEGDPATPDAPAAPDAAAAPGDAEAPPAPEGDLLVMLDLLRACRDEPGGAPLAEFLARLRRMARRHLPTHSILRRGLDSEDLAQEGLLQLLKNLDQFRGATVAEFLAFANAIIGQQAARQARWQDVRKKELRGGDAAAHAEEPRTPVSEAMAAEEVRRLRRLVGELAEPYRTALRMRLDGRTNLEIAAELGVREDLVRKRLSRALKELHGRW